MFKFVRARHRQAYMKLAWKHLVWPEKVYKLAHGKHAHSKKERSIIHELLALGIIHRHSSSSISSDDKVIFEKDND